MTDLYCRRTCQSSITGDDVKVSYQPTSWPCPPAGFSVFVVMRGMELV